MEHQHLKRANGRTYVGLILLAIGGVLLLKCLGFPFPSWLFQWPVILIIAGLFDGLRNGFRSPAWIVLLLVGGFFLLDIIAPGFSLRRFTWPLIIISIGIGLILRPHHSSNKYVETIPDHKLTYPQVLEQQSYTEPVHESGSGNYSNEEYLDAVAIFGATRKIIVSKKFKGGELVSIFGGHELDLRQADIQGTVVLDVTQIFGGTKLIVPSSWHVKSEMVALFGGIEDKRQIGSVAVNPEKTLILKGTSIFGGIDIRNY